MKKVMLLLPLILIILMPTACAEFYEFTPTGDDNYINNDTIINLSASPYQIDDPNSNGILIINSSNITLDCNGSLFTGTSNMGLIANFQLINTTTITGFDNVTIMNCNILGYNSQIIYAGDEGRFINNTLNSYGSGIGLIGSSDSYIGYNTFLGSGSGGSISLSGSTSTHIDNNSIQNSENGIDVSVSENTTLSNNVIEYNNNGIFSDSSAGISFSSDTVTNNQEYDVYLLNTTGLSLNDLVFGNVNVSWPVTINLSDADSNPVTGASGEVLDSYGERWYTIQASAGITLSEYIINSSGQYNFTPYTFNVTKDGYLNTNKTININGSMTVHLVMYSAHEDTSPPNVTVDIDPVFALLGENVSITANASDNSSDIDAIIISITDSNSTTDVYEFYGIGIPETNLSINHTPDVGGIYIVEVFANDTEGNEVTILSEFFGVPGFLDITSTTKDYNNQNLDTTLELFIAGVSDAYFTGSSQTGDFTILNTPDLLHDILFSGHNDSVRILLKGVNISENNASHINLDFYDNTDSGYGDVYAIETNYSFSSSEVTMYYDEDDFWDESEIEVYRCADWNLSGRSCNSTWGEVTLDEQSTDEDYLRVTATGFSAFTTRETNVSFCGDGVCQSDETPTSCGADCACLSGDNRSCSLTRQGICSVGTEECVSGLWTGCPVPETEACNQLDDDCDGVTDNIGGGTSVADAQCGCYNGELPQAETCNGIDDDCDGEIDEDGDCCVSGQTRSCGPSSDAGICQYGTSTCSNNVWSECDNAVYPMSTDICFNDEDDDCDGDVDELCDHCTNNLLDYDEEDVDCGGSCEECLDIISEYLPYILIGMGVLVLVLLIALFLYFKRHGKELTWEELMKKYTYFLPEPHVLQ
jgi:parallel beta-helix repeat protein